MTHSPSHVQLAFSGTIGRISLNHPEKHNALTLEDIEHFKTILQSVAANSKLRVLIITGAGDKTFCAGASLGQLSSGDLDGQQFEELTDMLAAVPIPTIGAFNGSAYGGGAEIGLCCDYRIGVNGMRVMIPAARFGLCYPPNGIQRYVQKLGPSTAKRLLMASEELDSQSLLTLGYLTHLVAPEQLQGKSEQLAVEMGKLGPLAVRAMKTLCQQAAMGPLQESQALELVHACNQSEDLKEGLRAKSEKREAVFQGK